MTHEIAQFVGFSIVKQKHIKEGTSIFTFLTSMWMFSESSLDAKSKNHIWYVKHKQTYFVLG